MKVSLCVYVDELDQLDQIRASRYRDHRRVMLGILEWIHVRPRGEPTPRCARGRNAGRSSLEGGAGGSPT